MISRKALFALFVVSHLVVAACSDSSSSDESGEATAQASASASSGSAASNVAQPRFLEDPAYVPAGFTKHGDVSVVDGSGIVVQRTLDYRSAPPDTTAIFVRQEYLVGGVPAEATHRATQVAVGGHKAYLAANDAGNKHSYMWAVGDVVVSVTGTGVAQAEVQAVAESMR